MCVHTRAAGMCSEYVSSRYPQGTPEPEPVVPATPEKPVKEVSRDLALEVHVCA